MLETLTYTPVAGTREGPLITVFALSTCGFCKKAMNYLQANGFGYRFIYVDQVPVETKAEAKKELKARYKADIAFPFVTVGDSAHLVGFIEADWKLTLGL